MAIAMVVVVCCPWRFAQQVLREASEELRKHLLNVNGANVPKFHRQSEYASTLHPCGIIVTWAILQSAY